MTNDEYCKTTKLHVFTSTMAVSQKTINNENVVLLEVNRKEKRVGRQKMKAAITGSERVSLVGREKWNTCQNHMHIAHCAPPDFSYSGV